MQFAAVNTIILINMKDAASEVTKDILNMWGFEVVNLDGRQVPHTALNNTTSIIIFQFQELSSDQIELLRLCHQKAPNCPIITTSHFISQQDLPRVLEAGAWAHLSQPFSPEALRALISQEANSDLPKFESIPSCPSKSISK